MKRFGKTLAALSTALLVNGAAFGAGPLTNFTGLWWNPDESGWGLGLDHQGDIVFGTLFTYDDAGNPTWYVMSEMDKEELNPFRGPVDNYMGSIYRATAADARRESIYAREVDVADMGDAVLSFQSEIGNVFAYNVGETNVYKRISPLVFNGAAPLCAADAQPGASPNYQGLWVNSPLGSERWGVYLAHQGDVIFGVTFAYDGVGNPTWRSMALVKNESGAYVGDLISSTGPSAGVPFDPALVTRTAVGSATLSFGDGDIGVFAATMNGVALPVKDIGRIRFAASRTTCK